MSNKMKVTASYIDYPSEIDKVMVDIGTSIYQTAQIIEKESVVNGETVTEYVVELQICDERMGYVYKYTFDKREMKQFINLMQRLQLQLTESENSNNGNDNNSGQTCNRIKIK